MKNQVVIITGASRGIGRETAKALAKEGARVVAVARSREGLDETQSQIETSGGKCHTVTADVTSYEAVEQMLGSTVRDFGRIDVLVNNAGLAPMMPLDEYDVQAFDQMMAVNCNAVFYACRAVWPQMIKQGGGRIVNISSVAATDPFPGFQAYGATKAWVSLFTEALAKEGKPHNIQVYAIAPGAVDTIMLRQHFPDFPPDQCLPPEEIARAICWILDERSQHASGAVVQVKR